MAKLLSWNKGIRPRFSIQCASVRFLELSPSCFPKKKRAKELFPLSSRNFQVEEKKGKTIIPWHRKHWQSFKNPYVVYPSKGWQSKTLGRKSTYAPIRFTTTSAVRCHPPRTTAIFSMCWKKNIPKPYGKGRNWRKEPIPDFQIEAACPHGNMGAFSLFAKVHLYAHRKTGAFFCSLYLFFNLQICS